MKSLVIVLALCSLLTFILADDPVSTMKEVKEKENKAIQECNATIPVQRNPVLALWVGILLGEPFKLSQEEKCFLHCFLQKVGLLDENANIRDEKGFVNFTIRISPEVAKYSDVIIAQLFQISRSTKGFEDNKCLKAYIVYLQLSQGIFVLQIADELQKTTNIKDKIITSIQTNKPVDPEVTEDIKKFKTHYETMMSSFVKSALEQNAQKNNSTRIEDKCQKAYDTYYQIFQTYFTLEIANDLQSSGVKEKIVFVLQTGQPVEPQFVEGVKKHLKFIEMTLSN